MSTHADDAVATALADLDMLDDERVLQVVEGLLTRRVSPERSRWLSLILRSAMREESEVASVAGDPRLVMSQVNLMRRDALLRSQAHRAVLDEPLLDSRGVADALGLGVANPREAASDLRRRGSVVGVRQGNRYLFPAFQFDLISQRVHPVVAEINTQLGAADDPWGIASWWVSASTRIGGTSPKDLVGADRDDDLRELASCVTD